MSKLYLLSGARLKSDWIAYGVIIFTGGIYSLALTSTLRFPDERDYYAIAQNLLGFEVFSIDGMTATAYRPPGFVVFLAALMSVSDSVRWLKTVNVALWAVQGVVSVRLANALFGREACIPTSILYCASAASLYTAGTLYPQTLAGLLFLSATFVAVARGSLVALSALIALLLLVVPTFVFTVPILVLAHYRRARPRWPQGLIALAVAGLILTPWAARNAIVFHRFIPFSTSGGVNLLLGNSEHTRPNAGVNVDLSTYHASAEGMNEPARDQFFAQAAIRWIREHPADWASLYTMKFFNWFNFRNDLATSVDHKRAKDLIVALTFYPIVALAVLGLFAGKQSCDRRTWTIAAIYLIGAAGYAVFFTRIRFRVPFDTLLVTLAAGVVTDCYSRFSPKKPLLADASVERSPYAAQE